MPDTTTFDPSRVLASLAETRFAGRLHHLASVGSTNQLALEAANAGAAEAIWVADEQTAGRGRGGHTWHSAPGDGLYASFLVRPSISLAQAVSLPLAAGLAAQAAVLEVTGLTLDLRWPNDLMIGERKCGGILVESASATAPSDLPSGSRDALRFAVIGIGLNLNHAAFPADLKLLATSLLIETGRSIDREDLLAALARRIDGEISAVAPDLYARFTAASSWVSGKRVHVGEQGGYTGWTRGLDARGFLQVEDDAGVLRTVLSGGVRSAR